MLADRRWVWVAGVFSSLGQDAPDSEDLSGGLAILVGSVISMAILAACHFADSQDEATAAPPAGGIMAEHAREVHPVMNANRADRGIGNARLMGSLLGIGLGE